MGGDEFLYLVFGPEPESTAKAVVDRLKNVFCPPMDLGGFTHVVTPSIGVAIATQGENWEAILERSDVAMYRAKRGEFTPARCLN
jgi:GGDEF domain-containing protein